MSGLALGCSLTNRFLLNGQGDTCPACHSHLSPFFVLDFSSRVRRPHDPAFNEGRIAEALAELCGAQTDVVEIRGTLARLLSYPDKRTQMDARRTDLLRGTLDLLVLKTLSLEPLHGVGISRRITQITKGAFQVSFGSLFPALFRMEERGWVEAEWRISENKRRAKYYWLTASGRKQLKVEEQDWNQVVKIMTAAVESA